MNELLNDNLSKIVERLGKAERRLVLLETQDVPGNFTAGSVLFADSNGDADEDNADLFWNDTDNRLLVGRNTAGNGIGRLIVGGVDSDDLGPHVELLTAADDYPVIQMLAFTHDNNEISFDAYLNSALAWKSSDAGSNFQLRKNGDKFGIWYGAGVAQGSTITWTNALYVDSAGNVSIGGTAPVTACDVYAIDSSTNGDLTVLNLVRNSSAATPAANLSGSLVFGIDDATVNSQLAGSLKWQTVVATHASRTFRVVHSAADTALREYMRGEASGTAAKAGFLGAAAVTRPNVTGAKGGNAALGSLMTALANLGLVTDSTTA